MGISGLTWATDVWVITSSGANSTLFSFGQQSISSLSYGVWHHYVASWPVALSQMHAGIWRGIIQHCTAETLFAIIYLIYNIIQYYITPILSYIYTCLWWGWFSSLHSVRASHSSSISFVVFGRLAVGNAAWDLKKKHRSQGVLKKTHLVTRVPCPKSGK